MFHTLEARVITSFSKSLGKGSPPHSIFILRESGVQFSANMRRHVAGVACLEQMADTGSLKDLWTAYRKKEIQMNCNVSGSKPIEVALDELPDSVEK
jgi:hypothetical protein